MSSQLDATGTGKLTMFQVQLNDPAHGAVGGLLGAFCWGDIEFNRAAGVRQTPTRDVFVIIFFSILSSPMGGTANLSSPDSPHSLPKMCKVEASDLTKMRTLFTGNEPSLNGMLCGHTWPNHDDHEDRAVVVNLKLVRLVKGLPALCSLVVGVFKAMQGITWVIF